MKLLEAVKVVDKEDVDMLESILECLKDRLFTIECQEPDGSSDFFYEKWEEKYSNLEEIVENMEFLLEDDIKEKQLKELKIQIENYQFDYGGLKRLKI